MARRRLKKNSLADGSKIRVVVCSFSNHAASAYTIAIAQAINEVEKTLPPLEKEQKRGCGCNGS